MDSEDVSLVSEWFNNLEFQGSFTPMVQKSKAEFNIRFCEISDEHKEYIIEKKDGVKIGIML